jgi:chromosome segregation ATPase
MRRTIFVAAALLSAATAVGQSQPADPQGLAAVVREIRLLRQDLQSLIGSAQRAQILIARVQVQEAVIKSVQQRIDEARSKLDQIQREQKDIAFEQKRNEEIVSETDNPAKKKEAEETLARIKAALEERAGSESETQSKLTDAEQQLRIEQAKLGRLQDELDRLDKTLEGSTHR